MLSWARAKRKIALEGLGLFVTRRHPGRRRRALMLSVLVGSLGAGACSQKDAMGSKRTAVSSSVVAARVFWLDSKTVAFVGRARGESPALNIYLWDTDEEAASIYLSNVWPGINALMQNYFCAADGELIYSRPGSAVPTGNAGHRRFAVKVGAPGHEVSKQVTSAFLTGGSGDLSESPPGLLPYNDLWRVNGRSRETSCDERADPRMIGRFWASTAFDDIALVFDRDPADLHTSNARLLRKSTGVEVGLPLPERLVSPSCVMSTQWNRATWFSTCGLNGSPEIIDGAEQHTIWRLEAENATLTSVKVPNTASTIFLRYLPTRRGVFFFSSGTPEIDGLFRFTGGRRDLIVRGEFVHGHVSPDGCRIALTEPITLQADDNRLVVVDVCKDA